MVTSSFEEYLAICDASDDERAEEHFARQARMLRFPFAVMLQVSYPELDFVDRWCWHHFGPSNGECTQRDSEYRVCDRAEPHSHSGRWVSHWFRKIDYDFGFNEWYFAASTDRDVFLANVDEFNWGEHFPK